MRLAEPWLNREGESIIVSKILTLADDPDPRVRLQLALTLGEMPKPEMVPAWQRLARAHLSERWMSTALLSSANHAFAKDLLFESLANLSAAEESRSLMAPLARTLGSRGNSRAALAFMRALLNAPAPFKVESLKGLRDGLASASLARTTLVKNDEATLTHWLTQPNFNLRLPAMKIAVLLKASELKAFKAVIQQSVADALDAQTALEARINAIRLLAYGDLESLLQTATALLAPQYPPALQAAVLQVLGESSAPGAGRTLIRHWKSFSPASRRETLRALLANEAHHAVLLEALDEGGIEQAAVTGPEREKLIQSRNPALAQRAQEIFRVSPQAAADLQARLERYRQALQGPRDLGRGREVFRQTCLACHPLGDEGVEIGPTLSLVTNRPEEAILVDLLDPGSKIDPEYTLYIVSTRSGESFAGILTTESATSLTLRLANGDDVSVLRQDILSMTASPLSLMPANLHEYITPSGMADLLAYLRQAYSGPPEPPASP